MGSIDFDGDTFAGIGNYAVLEIVPTYRTRYVIQHSVATFEFVEPAKSGTKKIVCITLLGGKRIAMPFNSMRYFKKYLKSCGAPTKGVGRHAKPST